MTAHRGNGSHAQNAGTETDQAAIDHVHAQDPDGRQNSLAPSFNKQPSKTMRMTSSVENIALTNMQILEAVVIVGFAQFANTVAFGLARYPTSTTQRLRLLWCKGGGRGAKRSSRGDGNGSPDPDTGLRTDPRMFRRIRYNPVFAQRYRVSPVSPPCELCGCSPATIRAQVLALWRDDP